MQCTRRAYPHSKFNYVKCTKFVERFTESLPQTTGSTNSQSTPVFNNIQTETSNMQGVSQPTISENIPASSMSCSCTGDSSGNDNFTLSCSCTRKPKENFVDLMQNPTIAEAAAKLPAGGVNLSEAAAKLPTGGVNLSEAAAKLPEGGVNLSETAAKLPEGGVNLSEAAAKLPAGGINLSAAAAKLPEGGANLSEAVAKLPEGGANLAVAAKLSEGGVRDMNNTNLPTIAIAAGISNAKNQPEQPEQICDKSSLQLTVGILIILLIILIGYIIYQSGKNNRE